MTCTPSPSLTPEMSAVLANLAIAYDLENSPSFSTTDAAILGEAFGTYNLISSLMCLVNDSLATTTFVSVNDKMLDSYKKSGYSGASSATTIPNFSSYEQANKFWIFFTLVTAYERLCKNSTIINNRFFTSTSVTYISYASLWATSPDNQLSYTNLDPQIALMYQIYTELLTTPVSPGIDSNDWFKMIDNFSFSPLPFNIKVDPDSFVVTDYTFGNTEDECECSGKFSVGEIPKDITSVFIAIYNVQNPSNINLGKISSVVYTPKEMPIGTGFGDVVALSFGQKNKEVDLSSAVDYKIFAQMIALVNYVPNSNFINYIESFGKTTDSGKKNVKADVIGSSYDTRITVALGGKKIEEVLKTGSVTTTPTITYNILNVAPVPDTSNNKTKYTKTVTEYTGSASPYLKTTTVTTYTVTASNTIKYTATGLANVTGTVTSTLSVSSAYYPLTGYVTCDNTNPLTKDDENGHYVFSPLVSVVARISNIYKFTPEEIVKSTFFGSIGNTTLNALLVSKPDYYTIDSVKLPLDTDHTVSANYSFYLNGDKLDNAEINTADEIFTKLIADAVGLKGVFESKTPATLGNAVYTSSIKKYIVDAATFNGPTSDVKEIRGALIKLANWYLESNPDVNDKVETVVYNMLSFIGLNYEDAPSKSCIWDNFETTHSLSDKIDIKLFLWLVASQPQSGSGSNILSASRNRDILKTIVKACDDPTKPKGKHLFAIRAKIADAVVQNGVLKSNGGLNTKLAPIDDLIDLIMTLTILSEEEKLRTVLETNGLSKVADFVKLLEIFTLEVIVKSKPDILLDKVGKATVPVTTTGLYSNSGDSAATWNYTVNGVSYNDEGSTDPNKSLGFRILVIAKLGDINNSTKYSKLASVGNGLERTKKIVALLYLICFIYNDTTVSKYDKIVLIYKIIKALPEEDKRDLFGIGFASTVNQKSNISALKILAFDLLMYDLSTEFDDWATSNLQPAAVWKEALLRKLKFISRDSNWGNKPTLSITASDPESDDRLSIVKTVELLKLADRIFKLIYEKMLYIEDGGEPDEFKLHHIIAEIKTDTIELFPIAYLKAKRDLGKSKLRLTKRAFEELIQEGVSTSDIVSVCVAVRNLDCFKIKGSELFSIVGTDDNGDYCFDLE